jgi:hypothetical protein
MIFPAGIGGGIGYKDNVLSDALCADIIEYAETHNHMMYEGPTLGGLNKQVKNCYDFSLSYYSDYAENDEQRKELADFNNLVFDSFSPALEEYCSYYEGLGDWVNRYDTGYQFQKYAANEGFYKPHCDGGVYLKGSTATRVLGVVMYLNTVNKGGGTNFPLHDVTVDSICGRVSFFPANFTHPHAGLMPLSSPKYIISTFCYTIPDAPSMDVASAELALNYDEQFKQITDKL